MSPYEVRPSSSQFFLEDRRRLYLQGSYDDVMLKIANTCIPLN